MILLNQGSCRGLSRICGSYYFKSLNLLFIFADWGKSQNWSSFAGVISVCPLVEISYCYKNVQVRMKTYKLTVLNKIFSRYKKVSLSYILKLFLNFNKFEPQYSLNCILIKKCIINSLIKTLYYLLMSICHLAPL